MNFDRDRRLPHQENEKESALVQSARAKLATIDFDRLKNAGFYRDRDTYFLNISYPSLQAMAEVKPEQVMQKSRERQVPNGRKLAVYIHVPFCTAECHYCHYYKQFRKSSSEVDTFIAAALREIEMQVQRFGGIEAASVYFGGGTPSYMTPEQTDFFLQSLHERITIPEGTEFSFEVHPESSSPELLAVLAAHGVNRVNIGVESFSDKLLQSENRRHTAAEAEAAYARVLAAGIQNVNLDLIYGLKGQTVQDWEESLDAITRLEPASATMYYLRLKQNTPEFLQWQKHPELFPSDDDLLLMHAMNFEHMAALRYLQDPVDWFIRRKQVSHTYQAHNWGNGENIGLLGIGPSAYSYIDGWQTYNINDTQRYEGSIAEGQLPHWKGEFLTGNEPMRRAVMLGIKMGIERQEFLKAFGQDVVRAFPQHWERLESLDLVQISSERIDLTYAGALLADEVGQQFYSETMKARMNAIPPQLISTTWPQNNR